MNDIKNMIVSDNLWITSDTHYMHKNIVRGTTSWRDESGEIPFDKVRNFSTLEDMNDMMVDNINKCVGAEDWLIHLGDWSFGGIDMIKEFREKINCKNVVIILGNHDHHIIKHEKQKKYFRHTALYEEMNVTRDSKVKLILCHYPLESWNMMNKGSYMLHGHVHKKGDDRFGRGRKMDVGMCGSPDFRPYHIEEIIDCLNI